MQGEACPYSVGARHWVGRVADAPKLPVRQCSLGASNRNPVYISVPRRQAASITAASFSSSLGDSSHRDNRLHRPWLQYRGPRPHPHVLQILDDLQARSSLLNTQWEFTRGLVCGAGSPSCVIGRLECTTRMCYIWALDCILATLPADPRAHTYVDSPDSMAQTFVAKPMRLHMYSSRCCEAWARLHRAGHFSLSSGYTARLCTT